MVTATFFGRPRLTYAGAALAWNAPPKTMTLLAFLALSSDAPIERDAAAYALWPDVPDAQARANLRRHLFYLERALPPTGGKAAWVVRDGSSISLNPELPFRADVTDFLRLARTDACESDLELAQRLYTGDLLEGCQEEWLVPERHRLYDRYLDVLERLLARAADRRDFSGAMAYAGRLLQLEPWREPYARSLMRLRHQSGDRCGALDVYSEFEKRLRQTYNIAPSPETIRLKELIEENGSLHEAAGNLPAALTTFIGRESEMEDISQRLKRARLLTIAGMGGVGKTRLALRVAENVAYRFDEVWYVDLAHESIIDRGLESRLRTADALLVLDGCERADPSMRELLYDLLRSSRRLRVLAAGRVPLRVEGESIWRADPLPVPPADATITILRQNDAAMLFVDRARSANKSFSLRPQNAPMLAQLCRRLEGLPLALELAAAHLESCSLEEMLREHETHSLAGGPIARALTWSYESLTHRAQDIYRGIAVFSGGWTLEGAENVCFEQPPSRSDVLEMLGELADKGLITTDQTYEPARYRCLHVVREYACTLAEEHSAHEALRRRHAHFYAALALELERAGEHGGWVDALARFSAEHANFEAALRYLLGERRDVHRGVQAALALWRFWREAGFWISGRHWLKQAQEATAYDPARQIHVLHRLASLTRISADYADALALYEAALELAQMLGDRRGYGDALAPAAFTAMKQGKLERAELLAHEALSIQLDIGNDAGSAHARNTLGSIALNQNQFSRARLFFDEALAFFESAADERNAAIVVGNLGLCALYQDDAAAARELMAEAIARSRGAGNRQFTAYMLQQQCDASLLCGDYGGVAGMLGESLAIAQDAGDKDVLIRIVETTAFLSGVQKRRASSRCLLAAATRARSWLRIPLQQPEQRVYERKLALLGPNAPAVRGTGAMLLNDAIAIVRSEVEAAGTGRPQASVDVL
jgi:predicted ATPase/DNA-binding SARP family transcriptional activator/Tfp pilus assembly protein PilF